MGRDRRCGGGGAGMRRRGTRGRGERGGETECLRTADFGDNAWNVLMHFCTFIYALCIFIGISV